MSIYYFLYLYALIGLFVSKIKEIPNISWLLVGVFLSFLLASMRYGSDFDYFSYLDIFKSIPPLTNGFSAVGRAAQSIYAENAFIYFVSFLKIFISDAYVFSVFCFLALISYFYAFNYHCKYSLIAWFVYFSDGFFLREFTQIRFGLAIAFALLAFIFLQKKSKLFFVYSVMASLLHYVAIVIFMAWPWVKYINTVKRIKILVVSSFALWALGVSKMFINLVITSGVAPERLMGYAGEDSSDAAAVNWIFIFSQFVLVLLSCRKIDDEDKASVVYVSIFALSFCLLCLISDFDLLRRVTFVFSVSSYMLASIAMEKKNYLYLWAVMLWSCGLFYSRLNILFDYSLFFYN